MKSLFFAIAFLIVSSSLFAQNCMRDSSLLYDSFYFAKPIPWSVDSMVFALDPVCIGQPYNMSFTVFIPDTVFVPAFNLSMPINSISTYTQNAIYNLPSGLTYECDPPNCVFEKNTLGCILVTGTPDASNVAPSIVEISLTMLVSTPIFPGSLFPFDFPEDLDSIYHYYFVIEPLGDCSVNTTFYSDPGYSFSEPVPNPASEHTLLMVDAPEATTLALRVFNLCGKCVFFNETTLLSGRNPVSFDTKSWPEGAYFITLGNSDVWATKKLIISH